MRQNDLLECDFLANSMVLWRLVTCVWMTFARCVAGAILWCQCYCVVFSWQAQHFVLHAFYHFVAGAPLCDVAKAVF